jgi:uncharacterized protein (TIGR01777 family)
MRILLAGASGFLGTRLRERLAAGGHDVVRLVRREPAGAGEHRWDPATGALDPAVLSTVDAVVNLAGAGVGDRRWTARYKRILRDSRVDTTATLAETVAALPPEHRPRALLNASAIGFYGDTGDRAVDETAPPGDDFLARLCVEWEAAAAPAAAAGTRVVLLRSGLPLAASGGLLKPLVLLFRLGLGGRLGSGRQYVPWVSMVDWLGAVEFLLDRDDITGPVNLTGPEPVTNAEFTKTLARHVHRPAVIPVPGLAMRVVVGEFSAEPLSSRRVLPAVLTDRGFLFQHRSLDSAIAAGMRL